MDQNTNREGNSFDKCNENGFAVVLATLLVLVLSLAAVSGAVISIGGKWRGTNYLLAKQAFYSAEAGVQDGVARLIADNNYHAGSFYDTALSDTSWNVAGTSSTGDFTNNFTVRHWVAGGTVKKDGFGMPYYLVTSTGYDSAGKQGQKSIESVIGLKRSTPFGAGVVGCDSITVTGRSIVDSYDSSAGSYDSQVVGNHARANDYAQTCVAPSVSCTTCGQISLSGGAAIYGSASAAGNVVMTSGAFVSGTVKENQPPTPCDPLDVAALVASQRPTTGSPSLIRLASTDTHAIATPGKYYLSGIDMQSQSTLNIGGSGDFILFIDGNLSLTGQAQINIANTAKVTMYITGTIDAEGGGIVNTGPPTNLIMYASYNSSGTRDDVQIAGSHAFSGAVYAPLANTHLGGDAGFLGAVRGKNVTDVGTSGFHYDEALRNMPGGAILGYTQVSWKEIFN